MKLWNELSLNNVFNYLFLSNDLNSSSMTQILLIDLNSMLLNRCIFILLKYRILFYIMKIYQRKSSYLVPRKET